MTNHLEAYHSSAWEIFAKEDQVVNRGAGESATLAASVKSSRLWPKMCFYTLNTPVRTIGDPTFTQFIDDVGEATSRERCALNLISHTTDINDTIKFLFPAEILADALACPGCAFLSPRNIFIDDFNDRIFDALPGVLI